MISVAPALSNCFVRLENPEYAGNPGPVGNGTVRLFPGEVTKLPD